MTTSLLKIIKPLSLCLVTVMAVSMMTSCHSSRAISGSSGRAEMTRRGSSHDRTAGKTSASRKPVASDKKAAAREAAKVEVFAKVDRKSLDAVTRSLLEEADSWRGTPYLWGGNTRDGVDCSGFVLQVFKTSAGISLPRVSGQQYEYCKPVDKSKLEPGDLVFFATSKSHDGVSHVGIYIGNGFMIHSSSSKGVIVSDLNSNYYTGHYYGGGRVERFYAMAGKEKQGKRTGRDTNNKGKNNKGKKSPKPSVPAGALSAPPRRDVNSDMASSTPRRRADAPAPEAEVPALQKKDMAKPEPSPSQPSKLQATSQRDVVKDSKKEIAKTPSPKPHVTPEAPTRPAHQAARQQQPAQSAAATTEDFRRSVLSELDDDLFN